MPAAVQLCVYRRPGCGPARLYPVGWRCTDHTPAREAGRPEPPDLSQVTPWWRRGGRTLPPSPLSTSWVHDRRAVESGRRVSGDRRRAQHASEAGA